VFLQLGVFVFAVDEVFVSGGASCVMFSACLLCDVCRWCCWTPPSNSQPECGVTTACL
jgi:hypothetical protein